MSGVTITADGLTELGAYMKLAPERATTAARMAINDVAGGSGLKLLRNAVQHEVSFPAGYIDKDKLWLKSRARNDDLEAVIGGRGRATSLARFAPGQSPVSSRGKGVTVQVHPGSARAMPGAFLVRLKRGASLTEDNYNVGLAIRLKPGDSVRNKKRQSTVQLDHNVQLLYGPSVDQVFGEVAEESSPAILDQVATQFFRQLTRLSED